MNLFSILGPGLDIGNRDAVANSFQFIKLSESLFFLHLNLILISGPNNLGCMNNLNNSSFSQSS